MIDFIEVADVLLIHANQIGLYGGEHGVRDMGILESALAQPRAAFGGEFLHADMFEMAAACMFHIVQNHPFVDGNKRAGLAAALLFLRINDIDIEASEESLYELTIDVATGNAGKPAISEFFRVHAE